MRVPIGVQRVFLFGLIGLLSVLIAGRLYMYASQKADRVQDETEAFVAEQISSLSAAWDVDGLYAVASASFEATHRRDAVEVDFARLGTELGTINDYAVVSREIKYDRTSASVPCEWTATYTLRLDCARGHAELYLTVCRQGNGPWLIDAFAIHPRSQQELAPGD